jgi:hypothetical protein
MSKRFTIFPQTSSTSDIDLQQLVLDIGCVLGGYNFMTPENTNTYMYQEYRIKSNTRTSPNDNGSLITGINQFPSAHLADNNVFFRIIQTFQNMVTDQFDPKESFVVLQWKDKNERNKETRSLFCSILNYLFLYKMLYSWAHCESMIPLFSLMEYQKLCQQSNQGKLKYNDDNINQSYNDFKTNWAVYSHEIANNLDDENKNDKIFWNNLGKLLAVITLQEQDIQNIYDLIITGNKAIILWGPPGTGKTYQAKELVRIMLELPMNKDEQLLDNYRYTLSNQEIKPKGAFALVQFHPNYTYEDFIGGISPCLDGKQISYIRKNGIFKSFCEKAKTFYDPEKNENEQKKFIFIIDEINRADLSSVFGELLYALEYRNENINIPNFDEPFCIPPNIYLIGTMNNVDKSLVTFDLALRRRFGFFKVMPNLKVISNILKDYNINDEILTKYIERCKWLNEQLCNSNDQLGLGLGEDYQIGQAYFGKIKDFLIKRTENQAEITSIELEKLWIYHIQPLLEEYLGVRLEDDNILESLKKLRDSFVKKL